MSAQVNDFTFAILLQSESPYLVDGLGLAASVLTLVAFAQKFMLPMRVAAIGANVFFIAYGVMGPFLPILALHLILLPLNMIRLESCWKGSRRGVHTAHVQTDACQLTHGASIDLGLSRTSLRVDRIGSKELI